MSTLRFCVELKICENDASLHSANHKKDQKKVNTHVQYAWTRQPLQHKFVSLSKDGQHLISVYA